MILTEEMKQGIIDAINNDAAFGFDLYYAIIKTVKDDSITKTYLDEALAKQSRAFEARLAQQTEAFNTKMDRLAQEFDEKLRKQNENLKIHVDKKLDAQTETFDKKLDAQSETFDKKLDAQSETFDKKLDAQTEAFDKKMDAQTISLKTYIDSKFGRIGSRWGQDAENAIREFFKKMAAQWGGTVEKWRRKVRFTNEEGYIYEKQYEIDMVVRDGTLTLVEVKANCDVEDIKRFLENIEFFERTEKQTKRVEKVLLTFSVEAYVSEIAQKAGIEIVDGLNT